MAQSKGFPCKKPTTTLGWNLDKWTIQLKLHILWYPIKVIQLVLIQRWQGFSTKDWKGIKARLGNGQGSSKDCCNEVNSYSDAPRRVTQRSLDACHPICDAIKKQAAQETVCFVLGNLPKEVTKWYSTAWNGTRLVTIPNRLIHSSNALRNDLLHPNEFIRGQSLRFLCKLKEADILEPLIPSVRQCLEHKHPYVRKNAVLAVFSVFKIHEYLIPDAIELMQAYIAQVFVFFQLKTRYPFQRVSKITRKMINLPREMHW